MKFKYILLLSGFVLNLISCDWREFDELSKKANVQVVDAPQGYTSPVFGQVVTYFLDENGHKVPGIVLVAGNGANPFAIVNFNGSTISSYSIPWGSDEALNITSLVPLNATNKKYRFIAGSLGKLYLFSAEVSDNGLIETLYQDKVIENGDVGFGRSVVKVGKQDEFLVASNDKIFKYIDSNNWETIELPSGFFLPSNDLDTFNQPFMSEFTANSQNYYVIGGHLEFSENMWGVYIVNINDYQDNYLLEGNETYPGDDVYSVIMTDLDNDSIKDFILGCGENIYIYLSKNGTVPFLSSPDITLYSQDRKVGQVISIGDLDGDGVNEIIASDPTFQETGTDQLGELSIYPTHNLTGNAISPTIELKAPSNEKKFGSSIITVPTSRWINTDELILGGLNAMYIYFITGYDGDNSPENDPRN